MDSTFLPEMSFTNGDTAHSTLSCSPIYYNVLSHFLVVFQAR